ncbi:MAG: hypothetical protein IPN26_15650 [Bacteroidetes bacterium]|nr:hypothetical protein [Bacteroidota bacterium]
MPVQAANVVYTSTTGNTALTIANYTWVNNPPASSIGNLYTAVGAGGSFNVGYHSTWREMLHPMDMRLTRVEIPRLQRLR